MASKYKKLFEQAWEGHKELFQKFFILNGDYADSQKRLQLEDEFQEVGKTVKDILIQCENELCRHMEKSEHRKYSTTLADKFWDEVRKYFKYIDQVGVVTKR